MSSLSFQHQWESALHEAAEISRTSALLKIVLGRTTVTRNEDEWSQTVRDDVRLSAYPLALWMASSWWRLRWEPLPPKLPSHSWRMTHELRSAGYGYVWPRMLFASEGENVHIWAAQSPPDSRSPVRYLENVHAEITAAAFERSIDEFIDGVLARLSAVKVAGTELSELWKLVIDERQNSESAFYRQLEAMLGFDADEGPQSLLDYFEKLVPEVGASAIAEIAPVCATDAPREMLQSIVDASAVRSARGRFSFDIAKVLQRDLHLPSWEQGRQMARQLRSKLSLNGSPVTDSMLGNLIGLSTKVAIEDRAPGGSPPLGLAVRKRSGEVDFVFRRRTRSSRRFEIARFVCDEAIAGDADTWLPATDQKTSRQKIQRAFAAEFLCPIDSLIEFLGDDFTNDSLDEAAEHFLVSSQAITSQLVNQRILPPSFFGPYESRFDLPYSTLSRGGSDLQ